MNFAICMVLLVCIAVVQSRLRLEVPASTRITIGTVLVVLSALLTWYFTVTDIALPGTDATVADLRIMIQECQEQIPRNQKCVIDLQVHPDTEPVDKD